MKLESAKCPDCGMQLHFDDDNQDYCFCSHCGTQVYRTEDYSTKNITKTIIRDEAKLVRANNETLKLQLEREAEERKLKKLKLMLKVSAVVFAILLILGVIIYFAFDGMILSIYVEVIVFVALIAFFARQSRD